MGKKTLEAGKDLKIVEVTSTPYKPGEGDKDILIFPKENKFDVNGVYVPATKEEQERRSDEIIKRMQLEREFESGGAKRKVREEIAEMEDTRENEEMIQKEQYDLLYANQDWQDSMAKYQKMHEEKEYFSKFKDELSGRSSTDIDEWVLSREERVRNAKENLHNKPKLTKLVGLKLNSWFGLFPRYEGAGLAREMAREELDKYKNMEEENKRKLHDALEDYKNALRVQKDLADPNLKKRIYDFAIEYNDLEEHIRGLQRQAREQAMKNLTMHTLSKK